MDLRREVERAAERIRPHVRETPTEPAPALAAAGARVFVKLENTQVTGSFKVRGALNKLLSLPAAVRERGVVAASSGNHGAGVAFAAASVSCPALVYVPESTPPHKVQAIAAQGAEVARFGDDCVVTEAHARAFADREGMTYISPYNDPAVIAGQGTIALELERQLESFDAVFAALGGGGLISGIGGYLKARGHAAEIVACSPENSPVMHRSLEAGHIVDMASLPTLSDSTAGGVEPGALTFDTCRAVIDRSILVSEAEISAALRRVLEGQHTLIEGAAAVAVAGFAQNAECFAGKRVAIVLCGANIGVETLRAVCTEP